MKTRIDFQPMDEDRYVVTKLTDTYRIYPQIVDILYACVPLFPAHRFVNVEFSNMGEIPTSLDLEEFTNRAKRMLVDAL